MSELPHEVTDSPDSEMSHRRHYDIEGASGSHVLLIEDERPIRQFLRVSLVTRGYRVTEVDTGSAGIKHALTHGPDIVILDLGLPDLDGIDVIRAIRESSQVPILVTSARERSVGAVAALNAGANGYLRKPIDTDALLNRIDALIRFARRSNNGGDEEFNSANLRVECRQKRVFVDGREIELDPTEFGILHSLIVHAGSDVTLDQLCNELGKSKSANVAYHLRTAMARLRRKIEGDVMRPRFLLAEPGIGYRLNLN